jgi:3-deoxy-D-glycero-D-galacto-nononate 9-phosphate synthase
MKSIYLIGEIGQNHNGSVDIAKLLIDIAARPVEDKFFGLKHKPMDAIKLVKRDLKYELSLTQMNQMYNSPHSFGSTYGEHRAFLELSYEEHLELYNYAKSKPIDVVETICAPSALELLKYFTPDRLKIASRDLSNHPLLSAMAETKLPIIISTGMSGKKDLDDALEIISRYHSDICILHCVSQYPTEYKNVNLNTVNYLLKNYKEYTIGYSDHTIGIATAIAAVAAGAVVLEKHITIDRQMKGSDQAGSLGIDGINRLVRDIRNLELSFGIEDIFIDENVVSTKEKLERSLASKRPLPAGALITEDDIHLLSPGTGYKWSERNFVIGHRIKNALPANEIIGKENIEL